MDIEKLDKTTILSEETFSELFGQEDEIEKARLLLQLSDRAAELGIKGKFDTLLKAYKRAQKEIQKRERDKKAVSLENWTNFEGPYDRMYCGSWIAREDGIYSQNESNVNAIACYHPILPVERLRNLETGEEQLKLAYKRNGIWTEITVPKTLVASANKITALSGRGVSVTSENAKLLVKYLSDVENLNDHEIKVQYSSSKLGWIKGGFLPYDQDVLFDGDSRFRNIFDSINELGSADIWMQHMKELRRAGRFEVKFLLAASFASILVYPLGALPFFVDLWGETEGGKTVTLMVAASVWGDPDESQYIGDFKTTDVALEARADMLNHLPMILDDTSRVSAKIRDNFEGIVYDLCSGKGKSRSNKDLGLNRENRWRNIMLTNGERPLNGYVTQGGAINRILEVEAGDGIFLDPQRTAETVKRNYGHGGRMFVQILKCMGVEKVRKLYQEIQQEIYDDEKMQKQSISLAVVLTADRILTEHLFQDGQYISLQEAKEVLVDRNDLSDNERCYQYILGEVAVNRPKFDPNIDTVETWGCVENGYAIIYNNIFDNMCKKGGFSKKSFLSWAAKKGLIQQQGKNPTKVKKFGGTSVRCVFLKLDDGITVDKDGFMSVGDAEELDGQLNLPFPD